MYVLHTVLLCASVRTNKQLSGKYQYVEILVLAREYCSRGTCTLPLKIKSSGRLLKVSLFMCRLSLLI